MTRSKYRCHGICRDGTRCDREVQNTESFCRHHPLPGGAVTKSGFAALEGFSPSRVSQLLNDGTIEETEDGWIEWAKARQQVAASRDPARALQRAGEQALADGDKKLMGSEVKRRYDQARMKEKEEKARLAEIERQEAEGRLICAATIRQQIEEACLTTRAQLMTVPGRIAADVLRLSDQREIHDLIEQEIRDCLTNLMTELGLDD